jgi:hypothetical protein
MTTIERATKQVSPFAEIEERIHKHLKTLLKYIDTTGELPDLPAQAIRDRANLARKLSGATGASFAVRYSPGLIIEDEERPRADNSRGHCFSLQLGDHLSALDVDDRDGPVNELLAGELKRVARECVEAADRLRLFTTKRKKYNFGILRSKQ